ncbi:cystathionine beta-synthase (beta-thionase) [Pyrrhoderma noxium]|uniref:Cystathionine beta-synthase (Beta-thionase) n=1 Tax=Pyrrhoderma noxium TaxID=2282107 RepID=A0A286UHY8_9AGAM|nr:cystathionine beta-synthase (beta-thionase) [Pyrrhoderma noxium]
MATSSVNASAIPTSTVNDLEKATSRQKFRGAVVEDLQLPPAFALPQTENTARAIELAYDRDFSHIPILTKERKPLGYLDVAGLKAKWEASQVDPNASVMKHMTKFHRSPSQTYTLITPDTPLEDLEDFLKKHIFALVTDHERKFVLAVATQADLDNFVSRRGL